jgi:4-hydroxythreonine-4-phosphate dehydrogenase
MTGWIGISLGDVTGVGLEVTFKAIATELPRDKTRYLLIGDAGYAHRVNDQLGLKLSIEPYSAGSSASRVCITSPLVDRLPAELANGSPLAARAAVAWLTEGAQRCLRHELDALVTAPVNKDAIVRSGQAFVGQTELLSQLAGVDRTAMMLLGHDGRERWLRVALVTTHVPLRQVAAHITPAKVMLTIELAAKSCHDLGLTRARIAVCGLNPHAGEGGQMGDEEQQIIWPRRKKTSTSSGR